MIPQMVADLFLLRSARVADSHKVAVIIAELEVGLIKDLIFPVEEAKERLKNKK